MTQRPGGNSSSQPALLQTAACRLRLIARALLPALCLLQCPGKGDICAEHPQSACGLWAASTLLWFLETLRVLACQLQRPHTPAPLAPTQPSG